MRNQNNGLHKICGCPRRTWAKCSHAWHFAFKWNDVHHRFSLDRHLGKHVNSKTDVETEAEKIRIAIKEGRFGQPAPRDKMTLRQLADTYLDRYVRAEHPTTADEFVRGLSRISRAVVPSPTGGRAPFGDWRVVDIVTDSVERFREVRRAQGTGVIGVNRLLGQLRALFNWGVRVGYVERTPFKRGSEPVIKLGSEPKRSRRLNADSDEEQHLLDACNPHLRAIVECALETGMRRGEILSLQWKQIEGLKIDGSTLAWASRAEVVLPWAKTKTRTDRRVPLSSRLKAMLEIRRFDPAGEPLPLDSYAFGNAIGQRVKDVKRAWMCAVLRAHGHRPTYTDGANFSAASRAALDAIDLHFHDLRREAGSRWLEGGVPLHTVRDWLGHTSIAQTSTYLAGTMKTQHDAMTAYEARRASLQQLATDSQTGGRKSPQPAMTTDRTPNKAAGNHEPTIM